MGTSLLGIFGASGLASGLGNDTGASGYFWHAKRCKTGERREKIATINGWPFKYIYRANLALATSWHPFSTSWAWSSLHTSLEVASGGLPEVSGDFPRRGTACHVVVSDSFGVLRPELQKFITFAYELRFRRSLYRREGEIMIYNSRLDFIV